jgi:hypothetical protein
MSFLFLNTYRLERLKTKLPNIKLKLIFYFLFQEGAYLFHYIGCIFKFHLIVGVEESIVNALYKLRITDQLFKSYVLHEWCVHNRLLNGYYEVKFKKTPYRMIMQFIFLLIHTYIKATGTDSFD